MHNLLDDPVFYSLLVNNSESLPQNSNSSATATSSEKSDSPSTHTADSDNGASKSNTRGQFTLPHAVYDSSGLQESSLLTLQTLDNLLQNTSANGAVTFGANDHVPPSKTIDFQTNDDTHSLQSSSAYQQSIFSDDASLGSELSSATASFDDILKSKQMHPKSFHKFYTGPTGVRPTSQTITITQKPRPPTTSKIMKRISPNSDTQPFTSYHKCPFCQRQFKNKAYLTRHMKMHDTIKEFKCPFFNKKQSKCHHSNGEFSRKDTLKAHLKSIHFIYPIGVSKSSRSRSSGRCAGCFKEFKSNNEWMVDHVEKGGCTGFASNYSNEDLREDLNEDEEFVEK